MRSQDWICPACSTVQFSNYRACKNCGHAKPTLNTMGQRCWQFYPLAGERRKCDGETHCPECHAVVHRSHNGVCKACTAYKKECEERDAKFNGTFAPSASVSQHSTCGVVIPQPQPSGSNRMLLADFSTGGDRPPAPEEAQVPQTPFQALCDKYQGAAPEKVLEDMAELQKALTAKEAGEAAAEAAPAPAAPALTAEELAAAAAQARREAQTRAKRVAVAEKEGAKLIAQREQKRAEAASKIQAMLAADEAEAKRQAAAGGASPSSPPAEAAATSSPPPLAAEAARGCAAKAKLTPEEEAARREKRAKLRKQQEEEEEEKRKVQRERRLKARPEKQQEEDEGEKRRQQRERRQQRKLGGGVVELE